ncbi:MAG: hypothetical protein WCG84_04660 [Candidatus Moraniibacteriota bacterium]
MEKRKWNMVLWGSEIEGMVGIVAIEGCSLMDTHLISQYICEKTGLELAVDDLTGIGAYCFLAFKAEGLPYEEGESNDEVTAIQEDILEAIQRLRV